MRNGYNGQSKIGHLRISALLPQQQSLHFIRIALLLVILSLILFNLSNKNSVARGQPCAVPWAGNFVRNFQPNLTVFITLELLPFLSWCRWDLLHLQESRYFNVAAIVEAIRSGLKFSADLKSRDDRISKIIQPFGWCFISIGQSEVCKGRLVSADTRPLLRTASLFYS